MSKKKILKAAKQFQQKPAKSLRNRWKEIQYNHQNLKGRTCKGSLILLLTE